MSPIKLTEDIVIPDADLYWRFSRSSGPGGQGVNTTDSRVELSFDLAGTAALPPHLRQRAIENLRKRMAGGAVTVAASEHRSQLRNRQAALERMEALLKKAIAPPPPKRKPTKPTRGSVRRRLKEKKRRSDIKKLRRSTED
ncbi:alternative ribosome rescue aminoacyl-tRNA hydrolase ArfB [Salininema proteolyticum]|uniref:Alternative ribosome rescue aminoacyl-tRNA hydrolase ArfB n=1 Tax=Salininema proteolyticum TaxID=1607685 RepID=A0ABV8TZV0_9ACTN